MASKDPKGINTIVFNCLNVDVIAEVGLSTELQDSFAKHFLPAIKVLDTPRFLPHKFVVPTLTASLLYLDLGAGEYIRERGILALGNEELECKFPVTVSGGQYAGGAILHRRHYGFPALFASQRM